LVTLFVNLANEPSKRSREEETRSVVPAIANKFIYINVAVKIGPIKPIYVMVFGDMPTFDRNRVTGSSIRCENMFRIAVLFIILTCSLEKA